MSLVERGLLVAGSPVIGTDWCLRDPDAWIEPGSRGTRRRAASTDLLVGHWTGGEAGARSYDDDGPHVFRVLRGRTRADGSPMSVGVHFVIGACDEADEHAPVWQLADPGLTACCHVGSAPVNARSVGVEVASAGLPGRLDARSRPRVRVPLLGRVREVLRFYPGQLRSWVRLAEALAGVRRAGLAIPRRVPVFGATRRMSRRELRTWTGAIEHLHVTPTTKVDAGGMLIEALADAGWERAQP